jgi:hypothetical protein
MTAAPAPPRLLPSVVLGLLDLLLLLKAIAFVPPTWWLWRHGPNVAARLRFRQVELGQLATLAQRDEATREYENGGADAESYTFEDIGPDGQQRVVSFRTLPRLHHFPPRSETFKSRHRIGYIVINALSSTPVLVITVSFAAVALAHAAHTAVVVAAVALLAIIASLTLLTAPISRAALGRYDVHWFGLQPYLRRYRVFMHGRYPGPTAERDGLVFYFLALVLLSTFTYAACYGLLHALQQQSPSFQAFHFATEQPRNWVTWLYFSSITVTTVGYGDITADNHWAQLAVAAQVMTGPFLLTWLFAIALSDRSAD